MTIDDLADQHCSTHMRSEQAQPILARRVHRAAGPVAPETEMHKARWRLVEIRLHGLGPALWLCPFLVECTFHECTARDQLGRARHVSNLTREHRRHERVELG